MSEYQIIWKGCAASNREIGRKQEPLSNTL
jgi:hypothetical protein